jgi:DNA-3-methyladenine glycosylase
MLIENCLPVSFYDRDVVSVARELLGMRLVRTLNGVRLSGYILETEAYRGEEDLACHARAGRTARTSIMYGPPGRAYVYFTYGMHWCLNCVTSADGFPAAVLIRGVMPVEGLDCIASLRANRPQADWCNGPGKLTQAFAIDGSLNGDDLCDTQGALWIETGHPVQDQAVIAGPRVGINRVAEPWRSIPWRFLVHRSSWELS